MRYGRGAARGDWEGTFEGGANGYGDEAIGAPPAAPCAVTYALSVAPAPARPTVISDDGVPAKLHTTELMPNAIVDTLDFRSRVATLYLHLICTISAAGKFGIINAALQGHKK